MEAHVCPHGYLKQCSRSTFSQYVYLAWLYVYFKPKIVNIYLEQGDIGAILDQFCLV